jgi:hypothetical protein
MYGTPLPAGRYNVEVIVYSKRQGGYTGVRAGVIGLETAPESSPVISFEMPGNQTLDATQVLTFPVRYSGVKIGSWVCVSLTQDDKNFYSFPEGKGDCDKVYTTSGLIHISGRAMRSTPTGLTHAKAEVYYTPSGVWGGGFPHATAWSQWFTISGAQPSSNSLSLVSPNGGETYAKGGNFSAKWRLFGIYPAGTMVCINLTNQATQVNNVPFYGSTGTEHCSPVDTTKNVQDGTISGILSQNHLAETDILTLPPGKYKAYAFTAFNPNVSRPGYEVFDQSDTPFTVITNTTSVQTWPGLTFVATPRTENTFEFSFDPGQWTAQGYKIDYGDGETMSLCAVAYGCYLHEGRAGTTTIHGYTQPGSHTVTLYAIQPDGTMKVARTLTVVSGANAVSNDANAIRITTPAPGSTIALDTLVQVSVAGSVSRKAYGMIIVHKKVNGVWKAQTGMWPLIADGSFGPGQFSFNVPNVIFSTNRALSEPATPGEWGISAEMYTYGCGGYDCSPPINRVLGTTEITPITVR